MALTKQTCQRQNVIKRIIKLIINALIKCSNQVLNQMQQRTK
ncbi:hypothetical protein HMPREF1582_01421 [Gardnerella vaginalis JCP8151A]|nr:hypothetical protein HMPREF1582_01421 [Gardnerella vaginalis JCP8151A]